MIDASVLQIEQASVEDAAALLALQRLAYQSEAAIYNDYAIPPLRQTLEEMRADFDQQLFLKALLDSRLVGSVRAHMQGTTCLVGRLIVRPDVQRRGIGTRLLHAIEQRFGQARRFELFTGHRSTGNIRLYQKLGYTIYRREEVHSALTMIFLEKTVA
jgi:GNAT superfamily N-acetyltransferase